MTLLSVVIPAYNAAEYLGRAVDGLLTVDDLEIVIIDDGSTDGTPAVADAYRDQHPGRVRVIHQPNRGHGGAINAGTALASGTYVKVLDSDDRLDIDALSATLAELRRLERSGGVDALVTNYVMERPGKPPRVVQLRDAMPAGRIFGWDEVRPMGSHRYLMMHSLTYRAEVLRAAAVVLPEHTFYVDHLWVTLPLVQVRRLAYLDVDLYRYFVGRADQSVNAEVMAGRVDHQLRVARGVLAGLPPAGAVPDNLYRYLLHHTEIVCAIASGLLARSGHPDAQSQREAFWNGIRDESPWVHARLRRRVVARTSNLPGATGRLITSLAFSAARKIVGYG